MKRRLILGIGVALAVTAFMLLRNKITDEPKPTSIEATPSPASTYSLLPVGPAVVAIPDHLPKIPPREYEYLPENKREAVKQAESDNAAEHKRRVTPGTQDAVGIRELNELLRELDQRLNQILTPEEKFEYDLRDSFLGQGVKSVTFAMKLSDEEHRAIFRHRQEFEKRIAENPSTFDTAWKEFDEKVRISIGEERFKIYQMIRDTTFIAIAGSRFGKRLEFEMKSDLYRIQSAAGEAADKIRLDDTLSTDTKLQRLKELAANCITDMGEILGDDAETKDFQAYSHQLASRMESLRPRSPRYKPTSLMPSPGLVILSTGSDSDSP
ncbi:MAG: hypothetical protein IPK15_00255 [Verrucomicrobia bacterium]|nr:hypothetical protein [Verrucomicrobiota bacterium]